MRAAGERGLSFDICVKHHQLASVVDLVSECPGTQFILDHAGKPDIRGRQLEPWREQITDACLACRTSRASCRAW